MFKTYDLFDHRNINDLIPEIIYYITYFRDLVLLPSNISYLRQMTIMAG